MSQLSLIIPFAGRDRHFGFQSGAVHEIAVHEIAAQDVAAQENERFESTLASILENRPDDCEIIVIQQVDYTDPYDIKNEGVRFVQVDSGLQRGQALATILDQVRSPIVHLIEPGVHAHQGWCDEITSTFDDPYLGSACPVILDETGIVVCSGIENTLFYRNRLIHNGASDIDDSITPLGPHHVAAFYQTEALRQVLQLESFGDASFGLEIALAMEAIGFESRIIDSSLVQVDEEQALIPAISGSESQNAIWRFSGSLGFLQGLTLSLGSVCKDLLCFWSAPARQSLAQRISGLVNTQLAIEFRAFVDAAAGPVSQRMSVPIDRTGLASQYAEPLSEKRAA